MTKKFIHQFVKDCHLETQEVDGKRFYCTPEGNKYPSITTVLSAYNAKAIQQWRSRVGEQEANRISTAASTRGTKIHKIAEDYILNNPEYLKEASITQKDMFSPLRDYLDKHVDVVYGSETGMYSDQLKIAGRCDLICRLHGLPAIVDFKTASKPKKKEWINNYFMQGAAYAHMAYERHNIMCKWVGILIVTPNDGLQVFYEPIKPYHKMLVSYLDQQGHKYNLN